MADDLQNTNMFLAQQFGLAQQQFLNYANTDIAAFTTPPDGGPFGNGYVYFSTVTNGVILQPSYPTVVNTVTGPAGASSQSASNSANSAADAALSAQNAAAANAAVQSIVSNSSGIFTANVHAWQAASNSLQYSLNSSNSANVSSGFSNTANTANTLAWQAESNAVFYSLIATTEANYANANATSAQIANNNAWAAARLANAIANANFLPIPGGQMTGSTGLAGYTETEITVPISNNSLNLDLSTGATVFNTSLTNNVTSCSFSNPPTGACSFTLVVQGNTTQRAITWPTTVKWAANNAPTITANSSKIDILTFFTTNAAVVWYGGIAGQNY